MGWKYGGKPAYIDPEWARWLNFWILIGTALIITLCLIANVEVSAVEANPILSILSLLGIISLLVTPFLLFISLMAGGTCIYGLPKDLWKPFRKNLKPKKERKEREGKGNLRDYEGLKWRRVSFPENIEGMTVYEKTASHIDHL